MSHEKQSHLGANPVMHGIKNFFNEYMIIYAIIAMVLFLSFTSDVFLTFDNMMNVLRQTSMIALLAAGVYFVMVSGCIDISLGALVGLTGVVFAIGMTNWGMPPILAALLAMVIGLICGAVNGFMVAKIGIPAMIATLGMQSIARGLTYVITNAYPIAVKNTEIQWLGRGYLWKIPWPVIIMLVVFVVAHFISQKTKFGRYVYAAGGNEEAAYLSGINVVKIRWVTFLVAGLLSAVAGCILTSRLASGQPNGGLTWEFEAITGAVIGGISITGGRGKPFGALLGAILIGLLTNGMTLLNVNSYYQQMIKGLVLVFAVALDVIQIRRQSKV